MGKRYFISGILFFLLLCSSCGKTEEKERGKVFSEAVAIYEGETSVLAYAVDKEGNLCTVGLLEETGHYCLFQYDTAQTLQFRYEFDDSFSGVDALAAEGQTVYFTANRMLEDGSVCMSLYTLNLDTGETEVMADYRFYDTVHQMILQDGRLYLLGAREYSVDARRPSGSNGYSFYEDRIIYYQMDEGESYVIGIDRPIHMAFAENGELMVHAYVDGEGYRMLAYDPVQDSIQTVAKFEDYHILEFAVCHDGKDLIYSYNRNSRGLVLARMDGLGSETELCPGNLMGNILDTKLFYRDGEIYLLNRDNNVMRFALEDVYRGNTAIRYISPGYEVDAPYGCGYAMERQELEEDKFVLKVLAQDSDYDLCLIDTIDSSSYNLRKNGVFYPLNDVPGVAEYLERCFPYVKEAATKDDGTVWVLPVAVYMPGLIVQESTVKELGIPLRRDMTWEEFAPMFAAMTPQQRELVSLSRIVCSMLFFQQYFGRYDTVEQEAFRRNVAAFQQFDEDMWLALYQENGRYLFYYTRYMRDYMNDYYKEKYYGKDAKVYSMPKLSSGDANTGTCILLAVNPASDRLQETLDFLADYVAWQMAEEVLPPFFQQPVPPVDSFEAEVYALYQNGEIAFTVDEDVYLEGFYEMLDGKKDVEEYIRGTERKLRIYFGE